MTNCSFDRAEIVVSGGMSMPQTLATLDLRTVHVDRGRSDRT